MRKQKATLVPLLAFCIVLASFPLFQVVEANPSSMIPQMPEPAFAIKSDGSIDPPTAPIHRDGETYTFTDNIVGYTIVVEKDNIMLDGGGYTLKGQGYQNRLEHLNAGIFLMNRQRVTVRNMKISGFYDGIYMFSFLGGSSISNHFENNLLADNYYGMYILYSQSIVLRNNQMKNNTRNLCIQDNVQVSPEPTNLYRNDIDSSNTVDGKPVIYWIDKHSETVPSNAGYVALIDCSAITVKNLDLSNNGQGILLISTPDLQLTQNHITHMDSGIFLYKSSNISITENELENNDICIKAQGSQATTISSNSLMRSGMGISLVGEAQECIVSGNTITINTDNGIWLSGISNSTIWHNNISENSENGITLYHSCNNIVTANSIASNRLDGIGIWEEATGNEISENLIANNNRCGLLIRACGNNTNTIIGNMIEKNNNSAIRFVSGPSNNLIWHNNFIENAYIGAQISFGSISDNSILNAWDNGSEGNYWSDYLTKYPNATETDSVGVGNMPYVIGGNNKDHYPLLNQVDFSTPSYSATPIVSPTIEPTSNPKQPTGFFGTNMPTEYGYAIVVTLVVIAAVGVSLFYLRRNKKG